MDSSWIILVIVCVALVSGSSIKSPTEPSTATNAENQRSNGTLPTSTITPDDETVALTSPQGSGGQPLDPDTFYSWFQNEMKPETSTQNNQDTEVSSSVETPMIPTEQISTINAESLMNPDAFFAEFGQVKGTDYPLQSESFSTEQPSVFRDITEAVSGLDQDYETSTVVPDEGSTVTETGVELLKEMFPESHTETQESLQGEGMAPSHLEEGLKTKSPSVLSTSSGKFGKVTRDSNIPSPDEFFGSFSRNHQNNKVNIEDNNQHEKRTKLTNDELGTSALIIAACVTSGILAIFAIVVSVYLLHRRKSRKSKIPEDIQIKSENSIYSHGYTDVFHGIPTNNDIWKNLDMLSKTAPSVFPDSPPKHS